MAYHVLKEKECAGLLNKIKRPENQQKTIKVYDDRIISMVGKKANSQCQENLQGNHALQSFVDKKIGGVQQGENHWLRSRTGKWD